MKREFDILKEMIADTGWENLGNGVKYRIFRGVCYLTIDGATINSGATRVLATLPEEARPKTNVNIFLRASHALAQCWTGTHGEIRCIVQSSTTAGAGSCCWPV